MLTVDHNFLENDAACYLSVGPYKWNDSNRKIKGLILKILCALLAFIFLAMRRVAQIFARDCTISSMSRSVWSVLGRLCGRVSLVEFENVFKIRPYSLIGTIFKENVTWYPWWGTCVSVVVVGCVQAFGDCGCFTPPCHLQTCSLWWFRLQTRGVHPHGGLNIKRTAFPTQLWENANNNLAGFRWNQMHIHPLHWLVWPLPLNLVLMELMDEEERRDNCSMICRKKWGQRTIPTAAHAHLHRHCLQSLMVYENVACNVLNFDILYTFDHCDDELQGRIVSLQNSSHASRRQRWWLSVMQQAVVNSLARLFICGLLFRKIEHHGPSGTYKIIFANVWIVWWSAVGINNSDWWRFCEICNNGCDMYLPRPPKVIMETIARASSKEGGVERGSGDSCLDVNPVCHLLTCWCCVTFAHMVWVWSWLLFINHLRFWDESTSTNYLPTSLEWSKWIASFPVKRSSNEDVLKWNRNIHHIHLDTSFCRSKSFCNSICFYQSHCAYDSSISLGKSKGMRSKSARMSSGRIVSQRLRQNTTIEPYLAPHHGFLQCMRDMIPNQIAKITLGTRLHILESQAQTAISFVLKMQSVGQLNICRKLIHSIGYEPPYFRVGLLVRHFKFQDVKTCMAVESISVHLPFFPNSASYWGLQP